MPQTVKLEAFKSWAKDTAPAARAVLMAKVFAQMERERVDAYTRPIFESFKFQYCGELAGKCQLTGPIADPKHLYLCDDPLVPAYYEDCDKAHREHGFTGPHGHCPALTAEHLVIVAENLLIGLAAPIFGINVPDLTLEHREKYLDLLIGACLKESKS